jgi:hypothetical protein
MRNTTKLKTLLLKYTVSFDMDDDEHFILILTDKIKGNIHEFEGESYGRVLAKAYGFLLKSLKEKNK